jgi:hypothetical protein
VSKVITLTDAATRRYACQLVVAAEQGTTIYIDGPRRSPKDSAEAWAICRDIAEQVQVDGRRFDTETWFRSAKRTVFGPQYRTYPNGLVLEEEPQSRYRSAEEFQKLLDYLKEFAAHHNVVRRERQ